MIPSGRLVLAACVPLGLALLVLADPWFTVPVVALDLVLLAVAIGDRLAVRGGVEVERQFAPVQAVGRDFPVELRLTAPRAMRVRIAGSSPIVATSTPAMKRGSSIVRSARSLSWQIASSRATNLSGSEIFWICTKVASATTCAPVSTLPGATTTPDPVPEVVRCSCHGQSWSGRWEVA